MAVVPTSTWPTKPKLHKDVFAHQQSRCLEIHNFSHFISLSKLQKDYETLWSCSDIRFETVWHCKELDLFNMCIIENQVECIPRLLHFSMWSHYNQPSRNRRCWNSPTPGAQVIFRPGPFPGAPQYVYILASWQFGPEDETIVTLRNVSYFNRGTSKLALNCLKGYIFMMREIFSYIL